PAQYQPVRVRARRGTLAYAELGRGAAPGRAGARVAAQPLLKTTDAHGVRFSAPLRCRRAALVELHHGALKRTPRVREHPVTMTLSLFPQGDKAAELGRRVAAFLRERIEPAEVEYHAHVEQPGQRWTIPPVIERLKSQARAEGLWNLFLPGTHG